jgi:hypothetical protein
MASVVDPYGHILSFLDQNCYYLFQAAPQFYSWGRVDLLLHTLNACKYGHLHFMILTLTAHISIIKILTHCTTNIMFIICSIEHDDNITNACNSLLELRMPQTLQLQISQPWYPL